MHAYVRQNDLMNLLLLLLLLPLQPHLPISAVPPRWMKKEKLARKLAVGFQSFKVINQPKLDVNLRFSSTNMQRMAALLEPAEQDDFLLIWKPRNPSSNPTTPVITSQAVSALKGSPKGLPGSPLKGPLIRAANSNGIMRTVSNGSTSTLSDTETISDTECGSSVMSVATAIAGSSSRPGAVLSPELEEEVRRMRNVPVGEWRSFHINLGAFLYCTLFQMPVPPATMPITNTQVLRWLKIKPEDAVMQHSFKVYK